MKPLVESPVTRAVATGGLAVVGAAITPSMATLNAATANAVNAVNMTAIGLQSTTGYLSTTTIAVGVTTGVVNNMLPYDAPQISINPQIDTWSTGAQLLLNIIQINNEKKTEPVSE